MEVAVEVDEWYAAVVVEVDEEAGVVVFDFDPEGDDPNAQGEPQDQDKKIWDKYYNGEIELPNVVKELKHDGSNEDTKLETSDEDRDAVLKAWRRTQNIYGYSQQKAKSKQGMEKEREEYEKKYLARYKEPKVKPKKSTKNRSF